MINAIPHRIKFAQGNTETHGDLNVRGGEAGEAGTYGLDHVIYVSGKFAIKYLNKILKIKELFI